MEAQAGYGLELSACWLVSYVFSGAHGWGLKRNKATQNVTLQVDLPGNVSMDTIKCQSCGAPLSAEDIKW